MKKKEIKITCDGADTVDYKTIDSFQGDLKELSEESKNRLKNEILKYGFNSPLHVWKNKKKLYNLDGNQRVLVLAEFEEEGYKIPPIPIDYIKAKNEQEARHILLSRVSQYGKVTDSGLYGYMADSSIDLDEIKDSFVLPEVNIEKFENRFFTNPEEDENEGPDDDGESNSNLVHTCPKCSFKFGKGAKNKN